MTNKNQLVYRLIKSTSLCKYNNNDNALINTILSYYHTSNRLCQQQLYNKDTVTQQAINNIQSPRLLTQHDLQHSIDTTLHEHMNNNNSISNSLFNKLFSKKLLSKLASTLGFNIYNSSNILLDLSSYQSRRVEFYDVNTYNISMDYAGYMSLFTIHTWLCHVRLRAIKSHNNDNVIYTDTREGKKLVGSLWDIYWDRLESDMVTHNNTYMFRSELKNIQTNIYGMCVAFDNATASDSDNDMLGALYRDIYRSNSHINKNCLIYLYEYIVSNINHLLSLSDEQFMSCQFQFIDPTSIDISKSPINKNSFKLSDLEQRVVSGQIKKTF